MQRRPASCEVDMLAQVFLSSLCKWPEVGRYLRSPRPWWKLMWVMGEVMPQREQNHYGKVKDIFLMLRALVIRLQKSHCKFYFVSFFFCQGGRGIRGAFLEDSHGNNNIHDRQKRPGVGKERHS